MDSLITACKEAQRAKPGALRLILGAFLSGSDSSSAYGPEDRGAKGLSSIDGDYLEREYYAQKIRDRS